MGSLLNAWIGEYKITELLGAGGMGEVYKAVHAHLGRVIAVKALSPELADGVALNRFYAEASIQASLRHPGVAEYLGFYEYQGRPCILMEFVDGETLAARIRRGLLPVSEAVCIMREIASVVAHFHAQGVVHRDLKSHNVKITSAGRVKVLDFGIARHQRSGRLTRTGFVIGTPEALAPEQVRGEAPTEATDIWQLGVMFYEMLTGRLPFEGANTQEFYAHILNAQYPPVAQWRPDVPPAVQKILARCLEKDAARRFSNAAGLFQAILDWERRTESHMVTARRAPRTVWVASAVCAGAIAIFGVAVLARSWWSKPVVSERPLPAVPGAAVPVELAPGAAVDTITVDTMDGVAEVYRNGRLAGTTPFKVEARPGEHIELVLRRSGFKDLPVEFEPTPRREYTYTMEPLRGR